MCFIILLCNLFKCVCLLYSLSNLVQREKIINLPTSLQKFFKLWKCSEDTIMGTVLLHSGWNGTCRSEFVHKHKQWWIQKRKTSEFNTRFNYQVFQTRLNKVHTRLNITCLYCLPLVPNFMWSVHLTCSWLLASKNS